MQQNTGIWLFAKPSRLPQADSRSKPSRPSSFAAMGKECFYVMAGTQVGRLNVGFSDTGMNQLCHVGFPQIKVTASAVFIRDPVLLGSEVLDSLRDNL